MTDMIRAIEPPSLGIQRVAEVDVQADPRWERFVSAHADGLIYHHPAWLLVLEREYGRKPIGLVCEDENGQIRGLLPLVPTRGLPFMKRNQFLSRRLSSLPWTPVAGPLALDCQARTALVQAAVERVRVSRNQLLQLKMQSSDLDGLVPDVVGVPWRMSYVLELPQRIEELRFGNSRNHSRIRWAVNKATKLGVKVRPADTQDDLRAWYALYLDTMRRFAVPPRPYRFFAACWDVLRPRGLMRLLLAERDDTGQRTLLAGSIFLMFGHTVFYAFNARDRQQVSMSMRPNDAIQWQATHDACKEGFRYFDFGEVMGDNLGLAEFKEKWGAQPRQLYRYCYPLHRQPKTLDHDRGGARLTRLATGVWRVLPLEVTARLGNWVYSFL